MGVKVDERAMSALATSVAAGMKESSTEGRPEGYLTRSHRPKKAMQRSDVVDEVEAVESVEDEVVSSDALLPASLPSQLLPHPKYPRRTRSASVPSSAPVIPPFPRS